MPQLKKSVLVIWNPTAGSGRKLRLFNNVVQFLRNSGAQVDIYETEAAGRATEYLNAYVGGANVVVVAGGDGTVNEVINGLKGKDIEIALIPTGTTNVLARELALPSSAKALGAIILGGNKKSVYLGCLDGRRFSMVVGVGYDAWVVNRVDLKIKKKFGKLAYILSMIRQLSNLGGQEYDVHIDGEKLSVGSMIVTNGRYYAGKFVLSRRADLSHETVRAIVIVTRSRLKLFLALISMPFGLMEKMPFVRSIPAKQIRVSTKSSHEHLDVLQADGDLAGRLPATIDVEDAPVTMLVASARGTS